MRSISFDTSRCYMPAAISIPGIRGEQEWDQINTVLVCLLGSFRLLRHEQPLNLSFAGKALALLSSLALHLETGVSRETLMDALWPEQAPTQSTISLNSLVYTLQQRLRGSSSGITAVIYANGSYYLNQDAGYSTDIARFDALITHGNRLAATGAEAEAVASYERAIALYRGDLNSGTDACAVIERERLRISFLTGLAFLADRAYRGGEYTNALNHALRLLVNDPCREDAHRIVMRAHVHRGVRAQALRQYHLCEQVLRREFDIAPEGA